MTPAWWGMCESDEFSLPKCIEAALGLANLHLMLSPLNELAVIGVTPSGTHFLHPLDRQGAPADVSHEGQYDLLGSMNDAVKRRALEVVESCDSDATNVILAGAVLKALCYFLRRCRDLAPTRRYDDVALEQLDLSEASDFTDKISARILILKAANDNASQYLALMNAIFTAQKLHIPIDTCVIPLVPTAGYSATKVMERNCPPKLVGHSGLFQQAADLTGGIYVHIPRVTGLLQYLISVFLPSQSLRPRLLLPDSRSSGFSGGVDFRAACFCHRRLIDIGYVCSVCLSVFCEFTPLCATCGTPFSLPPVQT
ncbi:General transcription factor IIH subunit 3 [Fasciolopsis buskii]|uniref:General transcription factor IIH subunit 3 n=1 Tax=Fasciolopsis buskii TaxID=27845 RepID=A0A8E0S5J0_9TREM|nr:General transcription factor IIH subunit 3 [Fasciolopsis buski]